jgi:hypothetical protein
MSREAYIIPAERVREIDGQQYVQLKDVEEAWEAGMVETRIDEVQRWLDARLKPGYDSSRYGIDRIKQLKGGQNEEG